MKSFFSGLLLILLVALILPACSNASDPAVIAVERYNNALTAGDRDRLVTSSCAAWEADALVELASFAAVKVTLEDMQCQEAGEDTNMILVACTGKVIANYGDEVLEINLADRQYQVVMEGGEWRMCGYR